jgi:hypothetical protein
VDEKASKMFVVSGSRSLDMFLSTENVLGNCAHLGDRVGSWDRVPLVDEREQTERTLECACLLAGEVLS